MQEFMCRAWSGEVMYSPFPCGERDKHPTWTFMLGLEWAGKILYELDILQWMSDDGDCYKGVVEFRENEDEHNFFLVGLFVANIMDISEDLIGEDGELLDDWDGSPKIIGNILEQPELVKVNIQ